jgi:hypothetical protein
MSGTIKEETPRVPKARYVRPKTPGDKLLLKAAEK